MTGMTGNVPYYGGRFTPAQAYAASHPPAPRHRAAAPAPPAPPAPEPASAAAAGAATTRPDPVAALDHLLETGVINQEEYDQIRPRVQP
jgi:hypothetical protein